MPRIARQCGVDAASFGNRGDELLPHDHEMAFEKQLRHPPRRKDVAQPGNLLPCAGCGHRTDVCEPCAVAVAETHASLPITPAIVGKLGDRTLRGSERSLELTRITRDRMIARIGVETAGSLQCCGLPRLLQALRSGAGAGIGLGCGTLTSVDGPEPGAMV